MNEKLKRAEEQRIRLLISLREIMFALDHGAGAQEWEKRKKKARDALADNENANYSNSTR